MADAWDESVFGDTFEEEEDFEPSKELLLFLIDASPAMLEPCEVDEPGREDEDKDFAGLTWVEAAVKVALHISKQKIISAVGDELGILLYSTAKQPEETELGDFPNCYLLQKLGQPGADSVNQIEQFNRGWFDKHVGSAEEPASLNSAFWMTKQLFARVKTRASRRILVFTRSELPFARYVKGHDPSHSWRQLEGHLRTLRETSTTVELYPMVPANIAFNLDPFWRAVLLYLRGSSSDEGEELEEGQQVFRLRDMFTLVRSKAHKRRTVARLRWAIGGGLELALKLYQILQRQKPGPLVRISKRMGHEIHSTSGQVDTYTGAVLEKDQIKQYFFKKGFRYPKVYMSTEEVKTIKGHGRRGMTLLGFKPVSSLKEYHQIRNSTFAYPDDKEVPGSATCFIALWQALRESGTMAVCRLAATIGRTPCLVALLPQEEALYEDDSQATPPGMQLIYLPFMDDIRTPETSTDFTGPVRHTPSESQVAAAEVMIAELQLTDFDCGAVLNPSLQRHYEVLESLAQDMEPPLLEDSPIGDPTLPAWEEEPYEGADEEEVEAVAARMQAILAFKEVVGVGQEEPKKGGTKRPAAAPVDAEAVEALGVEDKAAKGNLKSLTNDQLKAWLRAHGLPVSGKKDELCARVLNKLGL